MLSLLIIAGGLTYGGYPLVKRLLIKLGLVSQNYRGREIPLGYGLLLLINTLLILISGTKLGVYPPQVSKALAIVLVVVGSVGLADDCWGRGEHGGLSGHFRQFLVDWEISTG
ncbi:MAG: hypothetical protein ACQEQI_06870, partial [Bacillota bacterium]